MSNPNRFPHAAWLAAVLAAGAIAPAGAETLAFSAGGTFDAGIAASFFTAPGASWSIAFEVDSNPIVDSAVTVSGLYSSVVFDAFSYKLNGVEINQAPFNITLFNSAAEGGVEVWFSDPGVGDSQLLAFFGPQVYSGDETAPTVLPGSYPTFRAGSDGFVVYVDGIAFGQGETLFTLSPVPEPAPLAMLLAGLGVVGLRRRLAA